MPASLEAVRPIECPDVQDYILRGRAVSNNPSSRGKHAAAGRLFELALALDPQSVEAQSRLATCLLGRALDKMTDTWAADIARAEALIECGVAAAKREIDDIKLEIDARRGVPRMALHMA